MKCTKAESWMMGYLYGELAVRRVLRLEGHLKDCGKCSEKLAGYEATLQDFRRLESLQGEPAEVDPSVGARVLAAAYRQKPEGRRSGVRFVLHPAFSAAVMILLVTGALVYTQTSLLPARERKRLAKVADKYGRLDLQTKAKSTYMETEPAVNEGRAIQQWREAEPPTVSIDRKADGFAVAGRALNQMEEEPAPLAPAGGMLDEVMPMGEPLGFDLSDAPAKEARMPSTEMGARSSLKKAEQPAEAEELVMEDAVLQAVEEKDLIEADESLVPVDHRVRGEYEKGDLEFSNANYDQAIVHYQNVVQVRPYSDLAAVAQHQTAVSYRNMRQFDSAIKAYAEIVKRYPDYGNMAQVLVEYGDTYSSLGEYERALENYLLCARKFPEQAPALTARIKEASTQQSIKTNLRKMGYIK